MKKKATESTKNREEKHMKYPYIDDPEPKEPPETREDRFIKKFSKIFNIVITLAAITFAILAICGIVMRNM